MKEPQKIRLTDSPQNKKVNLTPLPSIKDYPDGMEDDIYHKTLENNENHNENNSQSIQQLESDETN